MSFCVNGTFLKTQNVFGTGIFRVSKKHFWNKNFFCCHFFFLEKFLSNFCSMLIRFVIGINTKYRFFDPLNSQITIPMINRKHGKLTFKNEHRFVTIVCISSVTQLLVLYKMYINVYVRIDIIIKTNILRFWK